MAKHRDKVAFAFHLQTKDAVAVRLVVKSDALYEAAELVQRLLVCVGVCDSHVREAFDINSGFALFGLDPCEYPARKEQLIRRTLASILPLLHARCQAFHPT